MMNSAILLLVLSLWPLCWPPDRAAPTASPGSCCATAQPPATASDGTFVTPWLAPEERPAIAAFAGACVNQSGEGVELAALRGKPIVLAFAYTRCANPNKCRRIVSGFAAMRKALVDSGLAGRVRQVIISYDPEYDTPERLAEFAAAQGVTCNEDLLLLRPTRATLDALARELKLAVSYNAYGVNLHRMECVLIDAAGRFVRNHHTVLWSTDGLLNDLRTLTHEMGAPGSERSGP